VALVLGGIAALLLAILVALDSNSRSDKRAASQGAHEATPRASAARSLPETEVEYPLDTSEPP
jgi:hypothetical protein